MRVILRLLPIPRARGSLAARGFASSSVPRYGRTASYRRIRNSLHEITTPFSISSYSSLHILPPLFLTSPCLLTTTLPATSRSFTFGGWKGEDRTQGANARNTSRAAPSSDEIADKANAASASENFEAAGHTKKSSAGDTDDSSRESKGSSEDTDDGSNKGSDKEGKQKEEPPPPPPHGNKTPWQVFRETLSQEFQSSKEWHDSTKALASSAHQFTENESVKRARAAYNAASGAATSTTSSALKGTGKALGQGAAWTWDTPVVKGVRSGVAATGRGIEKVTRPVRETNVYKTTVGGVKEVIDDGSSFKYGGWIEKEERRKQRELRELNEAGKFGKRGEKIVEDPKSVMFPFRFPSSTPVEFLT